MFDSVTVGETLRFLAKCRPASKVLISGRGNASDRFLSWRGSYEQLSISPDAEKEITVSDFYTALHDMLGQTITGWKGGDYTVGEQTELYADPWGAYTDHRIVGGSEYRNHVCLNIEIEKPGTGWEHYE
jgi:hypothetical protein